MEALESRELLAVSALEYAAIVETYSAFDLPEDRSTINLIEIDAESLSVAALKAAIDAASQTPGDDLVVVRTTDDFNAIIYGEPTDEIKINIDAPSRGALTIVSYGSQPLELDASGLSRVISVESGEVNLGGLTVVNGVTEYVGGGVCVASGSTTLQNCVVVGNTAGMAAGVYGATVVDCVVEGNSATATAVNGGYDFAISETKRAFVVDAFEGEQTISVGFISDDSTQVVNQDQTMNRDAAATVYNPSEWHDANKVFTEDYDEYLCWAATASNMLWFTQWGLLDGNGVSNSTQFFQKYFAGNFDDDGGHAEDGASWFITGETLNSYDFNVDGGYYADAFAANEDAISNYLDARSMTGNVAGMRELTDKLRSGYGVGLGLGKYYSPSSFSEPIIYGCGGHAITCWGYSYDVSVDSSSPNYYQSLFVTDSDDEATTKFEILLEWNADAILEDSYYGNNVMEGAYKFANYYASSSSAWYLEDAQFLAQRPAKYSTSSGANYSVYQSTNASPTIYGAANLDDVRSTESLQLGIVVYSNAAASSSTTVPYKVIVDGVETQYSATISAGATQSAEQRISLGNLSVGTHTIQAIVDYENTISESNENDGAWTKTLNVSNGDLIVTTWEDVVSATDGETSLREALLTAGLGGASTTIAFDGSLDGKTIELNGKALAISSSVTIDASNLQSLIVSGADESNAFFINKTGVEGAVVFRGMTIADGCAPFGGGVYANSNGLIAFENCQIVNCYANSRSAYSPDYGRYLTYGGRGGGLYFEGSGDVYLCNTAILNNSSDRYAGGGYFDGRNVVVTNSTIVGNSSADTGGVWLRGASNTVNNSIVVSNTASVDPNLYCKSSLVRAYNHSLIGDAFYTSISESSDATYSALFTDAENGDYTLPENSFAVDKGVNAHAVDSRGATLQRDLSGKRRIFGASVDLGAYEYSPDAPTAPTITATTLSATSIRVAWDAVSGATSYDVQYKPTSSSTWLTAKSGATQTYFNVSGLASGSKFDFRVCATDEGGTSEFSAVASAWTKPSAPKIAAASPSSATSVAVSWNAVVGANSYTLEYKKSTETSYKSVVSGITTTSTTIADLAESTTYNFRVKAVGYGGESTYSAVKTATLVAAPDPLPTPTITVVAASATALDVVWNAIPNSASYAVEYKLSAAEDWTTATTTATTANFTITELTSGASYDVRAKAVGDGANYGDSAWSAVATTWTTPGAPTITSASATSASEISVAWDAVSGATSYALEYKSSADANWTVYRASVDATSLVVSGLSSGASYDFRVQAVGEGGASAWSAVASAATLSPEVVVLPAPELTAASDATSITLSWTAIAGAKSYTLQYKLASDSTWTNKSAKATETSIVLTTPTLRQGETYDFRLRANGDGGATCKSSPFSAVVSSRIVAKLSTPTLELAGTVVSSSSASATLQWDAIANAKSYSLQYKLATANAWTSASVGASATTFTVAGLATGATYEFRLRANGDGGATCLSSDWSAILSARIEPRPVERPVLAVVGATDTTISVEWNAITGAQGYVLSYGLSGESTMQTTTLAASATSYTIAGLTPGATYRLQVRAFGDADDWEYWSACVSDFVTATTTAKLATPELATSATETSITAYWDLIDGAKSYTLQYKLASASTWTNQGVKATLDTYTIAGLTPGEKYNFRVRANGDGGKTLYSSNYSATATLFAAPKFLRPELTRAASTDSSITVQWTALSGAKSYTLQYKLSGDSTWTNKGVRATETSCAVDGLTTGETYDFRLRANGDGGATWYSSDFSKTISLVVERDVVELAPPEPTVDATTSDSIALSWNAVEGASGYRIAYKVASADWSDATTLEVAGTSVVVSGLAPVATYEFRAMTLGADGAESEYGSVLSATTKQAQLPTPTLTLVGATESTIVVGWSAISGAKSYTLQYRVVGATSWTNKGAVATDSSGEIAGLTSGAKYEVRLRANGDGGATYLSSNFSAVLTATAEPKLFTPTLTATATDATIVASWTAISGAKSYTLQYKASDATSWTNQGVKATETSYVFTNLAPGVAYDFRLRANGDGGVTVKSSEFSAVVSAKMVLALASPTLSVVETGNDAATLAWSAVDDAAAYRVEYRIAGSDAWTSRAFGSDATSATISGLTSDKTYEFRVCAVGDGVVYVDSEFSAVATAAIGVVGPVKLATPTLTVSSTDAAMIASWTASPGATSYALYYRVSGETSWTQQRGITADMTSYSFTTLAPGSTYDFQIRANGDGGVQYLSSDYSVVLSRTFVAPLPTPVLRVTQLSVSSTNRSITLSWDAIANAKSYTLQYKLSSASSWTNVGVRATETSYTLAGLAAGTYDFRLRANGDGGATCKSSEFSAVRTMPLGDALDVPFDPADELDDDLLTALAENWK